MDDLSLSQLLNSLNKEVLQKMARTHQLPEPLARKAVLVAELTQRLSNPPVVEQSLATMPHISQKIFERLQNTGGRAMSQSLMRECERDGLVRRAARTFFERPRWKPSTTQTAGELPTFVEAVWPLMQAGLLLSAASRWWQPTPELFGLYNFELVIPREILEATRNSNPSLNILNAEHIERSDEGSAQNFQRDVYLYWNYLRDQKVALTATGLVPKRHLAKINEAMVVKTDMKAARDESHAARLHFIRLLMEETGLIKWTGKQLELTSSATDFFGYSLTRRTDRFFEAWKKSAQWNELLHLPIKPRAHEERAAKSTQLVVRARQFVMRLIADSAAEGWLSLDDLVRQARRNHYEFLFKRTREEFGEVNPYYYYHNPLGWGFPVGDESEGWDKVESEFIRSIVREPLHWLGLVSLGYVNGALVAFSFTELGAYLMGLGGQAPSDEAAKSSGRVVVQPNFQIFALEPIAEQTLASLDRFADRVKADKVFEYHLTRESLYRAQQNGMTVHAVIAFLEQAATTTLPQNVQRTLEEWGQSYERIVVRRDVSLLHALDPHVLDALQAASGAAALLLSRPLPRVAIARNEPAARDHLLQMLLTQGQLPAFTQNHHAAQGSLVLDDEGKVTLLHTIPSIFLLQELAQHAERRADGYYLTEAIVKGERSAGQSLEQIIARWQRWHHGPLPSNLLIQLKRWGQFYGKARIRPMRLIQLPSADVVEALLVDPEIGPLMNRYAADHSAVFVADEHVERVRQWLEAHGVPVM